MGSFNPTYSVPEFEEVEAEVTYEFEWEGYPVVIEAQTGMVEINAGWTHQPERIVAFVGEMYESGLKDEVIAEYEMFHVDVTLHPLPRWMEVLARFGNEEEPGSVEEFFYNFMLHLGYDAGFLVPPDDIHEAFEELSEALVAAEGIAETAEERDSSWKPYCQLYSNELVEWGV